MADQNNVVINFIGNTDSLQASLVEVGKEAVAVGKVSQAAFNDFNKANQQADDGIQKTTGDLQNLNKVVSSGAVKEYSKDLQGAVEKLYDQGKIKEALILKYGSASKALKEMQKELNTMAALGLRNTSEFKELSKVTAELQDTISDTGGEIKKLASDTKVFDSLVQGARGVAAAFSVGTGVMAAFGSENKDVQKTLLKVQGAMAALQGVQELANIATEKGGIVTQIATAAQGAYAFVVGTSTGALKLFRLALAATGIGLAVIAITELVLHWDEFNEKVREFLGLSKQQKQITDEVAKAEIQRVNAIQKTYADEIALKKSTGEETRKLELQRIKNTLDILEEEKKKYGSNQEFYKFYSEEKLKLLIEQNQIEKELTDESIKTAKEARKKKHDDELEQWKQTQKDLEELIKQSFDDEQAMYEKQIADTRLHMAAMAKLKSNLEDEEKFIEDFYEHRLEIENAFDTMSFEDFKEWETKKREEYKATSDADLAELRRRVQAKEDAAKKEVETQKLIEKSVIDSAKFITDTIFAYESEQRQIELDNQLKAIEKAKQQELENINLTEGQKSAIEEKYRRQEAAAKAKAWKAEQESKAEQAIMNGLLALTTSLAQQGYPAGLVTGLLALAQAGVQAGLILSKPVPAFASGTEYVELGNSPRGTDTIHAMLNEGERVVPTEINKQLKGVKNEDLPKLMEAYYAPMPHAPELSAMNLVVKSPEIDYKRLAKAFAEELKSNPQTHINIDKNGISINVIEKGRKIDMLNRRYES